MNERLLGSTIFNLMKLSSLWDLLDRHFELFSESQVVLKDANLLQQLDVSGQEIRDLFASPFRVNLLMEYGVVLSLNTLETFIKELYGYQLEKKPEILLGINHQIPVNKLVVPADDDMTDRIIKIIVDKQLRDCWKNWEVVYQTAFGEKLKLYPRKKDKYLLKSYCALRNCIVHRSGMYDKDLEKQLKNLRGISFGPTTIIYQDPILVSDCIDLIKRVMLNLSKQSGDEFVKSGYTQLFTI